MYAIVESGGKQHKVRVGETVEVEKLPAEPGQTVELDRVLMVGQGDQVTVGRPLIAGAKVRAKVVDQDRARKITVFKYKRKVRYRRKTGHRQWYTRLAITEITPGQVEER